MVKHLPEHLEVGCSGTKLSLRMVCLYRKCLQLGEPCRCSAQIQISTNARRYFVLQNALSISGAHPASSYGQSAWSFEFARSPHPSTEVDEQSCVCTAAIGLNGVKR